MNDWQKRTTSLGRLRLEASNLSNRTGAMSFLKAIGLVPRDENFTRKNAIPSTSLNPNAIPVVYLAEVANEWDELGPSSPVEFVEAISFECAGTSQRDTVAEVMAALGAVIQQENTIAA